MDSIAADANVTTRTNWKPELAVTDAIIPYI